MWRRAWARSPRYPAAAVLAALAGTPAPAWRGNSPAGCAVEDWKAKAQRLEIEIAELRRHLPREEAPCYTIVLTGGPCAGKTTALVHVKERLENLGFLVFLAPEAATLFYGAGVKFLEFLPLGENALAAIQAQITRTQIHIENSLKELARVRGLPTVILCDRGTLDGKAYVSPELWNLILEDLGSSESMLRDKRYDAVLHLVTAARGAEEFYTLQQAEGAGARTETAQQARAQDEKTLRCWVGHPHLFIVGNDDGGFKSKLQRTVDRVLNFVGKKVSGHTCRKFKVAHMSVDAVAQALRSSGVDSFQTFRMEQVFLTPRRRIRRRCLLDGQQAFHNIQEELDSGTIVERQIGGRDYIFERAAAREQGMPVLEKHLVVFEWGNHLVQVNIFSDPEPVCIVEVEVESQDAALSLPDFLQAAGHAVEVTEDPSFESYAVSERARGSSAFRASAGPDRASV